MREQKESVKRTKSQKESDPVESEECSLVATKTIPKKKGATVVWPDNTTLVLNDIDCSNCVGITLLRLDQLCSINNLLEPSEWEAFFEKDNK